MSLHISFSFSLFSVGRILSRWWFSRAAFPVQYPNLMVKNKDVLQCTGDVTYNNYSAVGAAISFVDGLGGIALPVGPVFGLPFCFHTYVYVRQVFTGSSMDHGEGDSMRGNDEVVKECFVNSFGVQKKRPSEVALPVCAYFFTPFSRQSVVCLSVCCHVF